MRLAALSDIHGNHTALQAVLTDLEAAGGADRIWILGDLVAFCPEPAACLQTIQGLPKETTEVIQGNTDRYVTSGARPTWSKDRLNEETWPQFVKVMAEQDRNCEWTSERLSWEDAEYLLKLKKDLSLYVEGYGWVIGFHAVPGDDQGLLLPDTPDDEIRDALLDREGRLAFYGHIHRPLDRDLGDWRLVNVGSVGMPMDGDQHAAYALATFAGGEAQIEIRRVEYDVESVLARLEEIKHPAISWVGAKLRNARP